MNMAVREPQLSARSARPLRIAMLGLRGFPDVQGGVERHVEHLSRRLVELGCEVEAIVRSPYMPDGGPATWHGVTLTRIWSPRVTGVEALVHSFLGVLHAARTRPDILHIHSIGPALFAPLARALGLRVVVTHHVLNYENEKWGAAARLLLRLGERIGMTFANGRIAVSRHLAERVKRDYAVPIAVIPNGLGELTRPQSDMTLQQHGLTPGRYLLTVARIDPQKCQLDLIEAFRAAQPVGWTLALAGGADYATDYVRAVIEAARATPGVVLLGHQKEVALAELYAHAGAFVLPSSHEGQPIAVIEALGYGCPVILSDIPAHRELGITTGQFFRAGDTAALAQRLRAVFRDPPDRANHVADRDRILKRHDWRVIARSTLEVYRAALPARRAVGLRLGLRD
jgi:glycosyltransferase involved in cell wall biosynthesis